MRYRKKPVVIDAIQWTGINVQEILGWLGELSRKWKWDAELSKDGALFTGTTQKVNFDLTAKPHIKLVIATLNGDMAVEHGEFILCGVQGEIYPCKADIFEATYDKVHPDYVEGDDSPFTFQTCSGCGQFLDSCECSWNFDHKKAKQTISEAELLSGTLTNKPKEVMRDLADLLEDSLRLDSERRIYYDNFKLVQEDRHKKIDELAHMKKMRDDITLQAMKEIDELRKIRDSLEAENDDVNEALAKLAPALKAFRDSDHSFGRAPTTEGQAVLDVWDQVVKILAP